MEKLTIFIDGNRFDISVQDEFMELFREKIEEDLSLKENNSVKTLLYSYLRKSYELFELQQKIEELSTKLSRRS